MTSFAEQAWTSVGGRFADVVAHPFVTSLADGSLPHETFVRYLVDDAHYLLSYARTLAAIAARMPDADGVATLAAASAGAIEAERGLHRGFLVPLGIDPDASDAPPPTPTCRGYTGFLAEQAAAAPVEVAMAAVLPCFRVYAEVGRRVATSAEGRPPGADLHGHPYRDWIATYADDDFADAVRRAEQQCDRLAETSPRLVPRMLSAYAVSTDWEWRFFDAPWRGEVGVG